MKTYLEYLKELKEQKKEIEKQKDRLDSVMDYGKKILTQWPEKPLLSCFLPSMRRLIQVCRPLSLPISQ